MTRRTIKVEAGVKAQVEVYLDVAGAAIKVFQHTQSPSLSFFCNQEIEIEVEDCLESENNMSGR